MKFSSILLTNILHMIKRHKVIFIGLLIQSIICFYLITLIMDNYLSSQSSVNDFTKYIGSQNYYQLHSMSDDDFSSYINNQDNDYAKLKKFINLLSFQKQFKFISVINQPIDMITKQVSQKFVYGYELGSPIPSGKDKQGNIVESVKCLQLSSNAFSQFNLQIESGCGFNSDDYTYKRDSSIPVILGSEYKGIFNIGSSFDANFLSVKMHFTVVGFFRPNTSILFQDKLNYLDRYMVMPAFSPANNSPDDFYKKILDQQSGGVILSKQSLASVRSTISQLVLQSGTKSQVLTQPNASMITNLVSTSNETIIQLMLLTVSMIIFTVISISLALIGIIRRNYYEYGIHLICGATLHAVFLQIAGFVASILIIGYLISAVLIRSYYPSLLAESVAFIVCILIYIVSVIAPFYIIKKTDINQLIRGKK